MALTRRPPELAAEITRLGAEITREHERCEASWRTALGHAVKVGELLIEAKAQLRHGEWSPWLAEHLPLSERTARAYMQLAAEPGLLKRQAPAHLTIEKALRSIAQPAARAPSPKRAFPSSPTERELWRQIHQALARVERFMDDASRDGLSNWSRGEALHEAARHARNAVSRLSELAGLV